MTLLENENKSLIEQRELFLKDSQAMKDQITALESQLEDTNRFNKTAETAQIIQIVNHDVKEDFSQFQQHIDELKDQLIQQQKSHIKELESTHSAKKQLLLELKNVKSQFNFMSTENEVLNLKVRQLEDQVANPRAVKIEKL